MNRDGNTEQRSCAPSIPKPEIKKLPTSTLFKTLRETTRMMPHHTRLCIQLPTVRRRYAMFTKAEHPIAAGKPENPFTVPNLYESIQRPLFRGKLGRLVALIGSPEPPDKPVLFHQ